MYDDIKEQFKSVIQYSQNIPDPKIDDLFDRWAAAKSKFIQRFGGLIYEWPEQIEFTLDAHDQKQRAMDFADCVCGSFNNVPLADFLDQNLETFFENTVSHSDIAEIPTGMKLIKAFKYFEKDKTTLNKIQSLASQLIQENKIKGTLCFSVHPLDFLSSSENGYNWRSCHALDGDYRAGNLSYMVDESTFMVYLKGPKDIRIPMFGDVKWNSKKWRMLLYTNSDDSVLFAGRQYPFSSKKGINIVLNAYNYLMANSQLPTFNTWQSDYIDSYTSPETSAYLSLCDRYFIYNTYKLYGLQDIMKEAGDALNYNDVLHSSCYTKPYYATRQAQLYDLFGDPPKSIIVGGAVKCLHCGKRIIQQSGVMRCDECELTFGTEENEIYGTCACCGARIYLDDSFSVGEDGDYVCSSCFQQECFVCDCCGEAFYKEDSIFIPEDKDIGIDLWYCKYCYEDLQNKEDN